MDIIGRDSTGKALKRYQETILSLLKVGRYGKRRYEYMDYSVNAPKRAFREHGTSEYRLY